MINYNSILSAFDGKPTLLQWLKMVKKALDESILKNVDITQNGEKVVFTFNFEDGTSISTPEVTLPKGDKGDTGATGATGPKGDDGVSITGINTVGNEVVADETLTTLRANYSNGNSDEFVVTAKNGSSSGSANIYTHSIKFKDNSSGRELYFNIYSNKEALTIDDVFGQIPVNNYIPMCFKESSMFGVLSVKKSSAGDYIYPSGMAWDGSKVIFIGIAIGKTSIKMTDELLGVNL